VNDPRHTTHDDPLPLIEALINGTIDDPGFARLDELLASDLQARAMYRRYVNLHTALRDVLGQQPHLALKLPGETAQALTLSPDDSALGGERFAELLASLDATEDDPPQTVDLSEQLQACARQAREARLAQRREARDQAAAYVREVTLDVLTSRRLYAGLAAVLAVAVLIWVLWPAGSGSSHKPIAGPTASAEPAPIAVAALTAEHDAQWAAFNLKPGDTLYAGQRLTLKQGFAEITTDRGALAVVEAPATIELMKRGHALRLHAGKLVAVCETESAKGFTVHTPTARLVDLGTEFGVEVGRRGSTHASVFDGEIELGERGERPGQPVRSVRLTAGWSSRVSNTGSLRRTPAPLSGSDHARFVRSIDQATDPVQRARRAVLATRPAVYWAFERMGEAGATNLIHGDRDGLQGFGDVAAVDGPFGKAIRFAGNAAGTDYLLSPQPIEALTDASQYTMSAWCRMDARHNGRIVGLHAVGGAGDARPRQAAALQVHARPIDHVSPPVPADSARFVHRDPPGSDSRTGTNVYARDISPGRWMHLVAVKHTDRVELYIDGRLVDSAAEPGRVSGQAYALIGVSPQALMADGEKSDYRPFDGLIDEVALYDRALSPKEINQLFDAHAPLLKEKEARP